MSTATEANPSLGPLMPGYDATNHQTNVALRVTNISTDTSVTPNVTYGDLVVNATVSSTPPSAVVSTVNSSTTLLTANSVFTGTGESSLAYGSISVEVFTDQASATNGLEVAQSQDNVNWDIKNTYSVSASTAFQQTINLVGQYYRVKYTNGGTNQGVFRLQTIKEVAPASSGSANQRVNAQSGDFVSGSIADLTTIINNTADLLADGDHLAPIDTATAAMNTSLTTIAGAVSGSKVATKAASGDFADGAQVAIGTTTQTKATDGTTTSWSVIQLLKGVFDKLLSTLAVTQSGAWTVQPGNTANTTAWKVDGSAVTQPVSISLLTDTFTSATNITAATTFSGTPTVSQLAANSSVSLANAGDQATFQAEINIPSAFVGTLSFYGLEADGTTLQLINAHMRGSTTTSNNIAINTGVALNQDWMGSIATFKTFYVVCTAYTSGTASVALGMSAAPYGIAILNTANMAIQATAGTALLADQSNTELRTSVYGKNATAGDTALNVDASGRIVLAPNQTVEIVDSAGTNKLAVDASGRLTLIPNSSVNIAQMGGVATQMMSADGVTAANVMEMGIGGYNGTTIDRVLADLKALRVSLYGKSSASGDTALGLDASGRVTSLISDGTQTANTFAADSGQNGQIIGSGVKTFTYSITANSATTAIDLANYPAFSINITAVGSGGTLNFQSCDTNVSADFGIQVVMSGTATAAGNPVSSATAVGRFYGNRTGRYLRINPTGIASGTYAVTITCYTNASTNTSIGGAGVAQTGTWSVGPAANVTAISSAAYTTTQTQADGTNSSGKGARVTLDVTSAGTGSVTLEIDAKDSTSGKYVALLTGAAVTTNSTNVYVVYPGLTAVANSVASDVLPTIYRIKVVANNANSMTYSVGTFVLP